MSDYKKNIANKSGKLASVYRVNLKRGKGKKISPRDFDYLVNQLKPLVAGVLAEREFVDPNDFEIWKFKLQKLTKEAYLTTGIQTDVYANFEILRELEGNLSSIGVKTLYSNLSPKLNTVSIDIDMVNSLLSAAIRNNVEQRRYFEQEDERAYRGRSRGYVDFNYSDFYSPELRRHWKEKASISILDYLRKELSSEEESVFSLSGYYEQFTVVNILKAYLENALSGSDEDKKALMELLLDLSLKIVFLPKEALGRVETLEDRILIVKKPEPYDSVPKYYCESVNKASRSKLLVNEVFIWNEDESKMEKVTSSEQAVVVMNEAVIEEREKIRSVFDNMNW